MQHRGWPLFTILNRIMFHPRSFSMFLCIFHKKTSKFPDILIPYISVHVSMTMSLVHVSMSMSPCLHASMSPFLHISMSHVYVSMFPCFNLHAFMSPYPCPCLQVSGIPQMENGNFCLFAANIKQKRQTSVFSENGNGKRKFVFLG